MENRKACVTAGFMLLFLIGLSLGFGMRVGHAEYDNIRQSFYATKITAQTIAASGTYTSTPFTSALAKSETQTVQVQGTGTGPNYKVEMLVTIDGTNYAKPEIGGDLGTYTDTSLHIIPVFVPLSIGHKLKITEMGGSNSITITAGEISQ